MADRFALRTRPGTESLWSHPRVAMLCHHLGMPSLVTGPAIGFSVADLHNVPIKSLFALIKSFADLANASREGRHLNNRSLVACIETKANEVRL